MAMVETNSSWLQQTLEQSRTFDSRAKEAAQKLSNDQLNWRPDKDTWSVGQEFHHLVLTNRSYVEVLERFSENAPSAKAEYNLSFVGKLLLRGAGPSESVPVPVPKPLIPTDAPLSQAIVDEFLALQDRFHAVVPKIADKDLNSRFSSPIAKFIKLKVGDAIQILEQHNERHINKIMRLLDRPEFPK